jgi:protocatechuate 3,4-dioxygenase beta subunit
MKRIAIALSLLLVASPLLADVRGTVVDAEGVPVADAAVELFVATPAGHDIAELLAGRELKAAGTARSDAKGNFRIAAKSGNYMLYWSAAGFAPGAIETTGDEELGGLLLRAAPMKRGQVTAGGKAVPNAVVVLARYARVITKTDDEGRYSVPDPRVWSPSITVIHSNYAIATVSSGFSETPVPLDVQLVAGSTLTGRVVGPDGRSGVRAELFVDGIAAGESADDGTYELRRVPRDWKELAAVRGNLVARAGRAASRTLQLTQAFSLSGNVVDPATGVGISGAIVSVSPTTWDAAQIGTAITDARGGFVIPALLPGTYRVSAMRAGYSSASEVTPLNAGARKTLPIQQQAFVTGTITEEQRRPVAAASVWTASRRPNTYTSGEGRSQVSAPDGRYAFRVNPALSDEMDVVARRKGYVSTPDGPHRFRGGERKTVNITLKRGLALEGRVLDAQAQPLRDVAVSAIESPANTRGFAPPPQSWNDLPTTDAEGRFSLRVNAGMHTLYFHLSGYAPKKVPAVSVSAESQPLEVTLERAASITGRVVTASGEPVADAQVGAMVEGPYLAATTDATGAFRLDGLAPTLISISAWKKNGMNRVELQIKAPAEGVTIELMPTVRITGRVLAKGGGSIRDFQVRVGSPRPGGSDWEGPARPVDVHDADGRFVLEEVEVRPAELVVRAPGHVAAYVPLQLEKGRNVENVEVTLERAATIQGRVTDEAGSALRGVFVFGQVGRGSRPESVVTNAGGEYVLDGVPSGETTLTFTRSGYQVLKKQVELEAGETTVDVRLSAGRVLTGQVVDERGSPIAEASITASAENAGGSYSHETTDAAGRFRLEGLGPFIYRVTASRRGFLGPEPEAVDVAKTSNVTIRMQAGAVVTGTITGIDRSQFRDVSVSAGSAGRPPAQAQVDDSGRYRLEGVPTGKIGLRAFARGASSRTSELVELETTNGGTYEVDLEFREHNTIRGKVTRRGVPVRAGNIVFSPATGRGAATGSIDANGEYEVTGVRSGEYNIIVRGPQSAAMNYFATRTIARSETIDVDMNPAVVRGRIVDETTGEPIAEAEIVLERTDAGSGAMRASGRSGSDGRVILNDVVPATYDLRIARAGYATHLASQTIAEGATHELEVALKRSAGLVLHLIDGRNGQRVVAAIVARTPAGAIAFKGFPQSRADGSMLVPLAPGSYRIQLAPNGLANIEIAAESPGTREVTLHPGGTLEIATSCTTCRARIIDGAGAPYYVDTSITTTDFPIMNGTRITDVAVGAYTFEWLNAAGEITKREPFVIRVGAVTRVGM